MWNLKEKDGKIYSIQIVTQREKFTELKNCHKTLFNNKKSQFTRKIELQGS